MARGMDADTAREEALKRLGDLQTVQEECTTLLASERRDEARRMWMKMSWLDFKLGFRMLAKYPGLTVIGGLAMALAIAVGAVGLEATRQLVAPSLPLPRGRRCSGSQSSRTTLPAEFFTLHARHRSSVNRNIR